MTFTTACPWIEITPEGFAQPTEAANERAQNAHPSTYTEEADRAVKAAVAHLYFFLEEDRTVKAFRTEALRVWDELEAAHFEAGISDTEPRGYFLDHLDNMAQLEGWLPVIEAL